MFNKLIVPIFITQKSGVGRSRLTLVTDDKGCVRFLT